MRVSGAAILDQAVRLGYPFRESLRSLLPLVDELIVNVGAGDDETWRAVLELGDSRIRPFRSEWDRSPRGGAVLSEQTNLALARCSGDWIVYLQADEVLHEDDLPRLRASLLRHLERDTEGLVFDYVHLFLSPRVCTDDWLAFYPRAVRAVKNGIGVLSAGDAAGFVRAKDGARRGLLKARSGARVFHYGWCGPIEARVMRANALSALYEPGRSVEAEALFPRDLSAWCGLRRFTGGHPAAMRERIEAWAELPGIARGWRWPAALRAYARLLAAPRAYRDQARAFLPLALTNARWRLRDLYARAAAARPPGPSGR